MDGELSVEALRYNPNNATTVVVERVQKADGSRVRKRLRRFEPGQQQEDRPTNTDSQPTNTGTDLPSTEDGPADDERRNQMRIRGTGEPERDALGNESGSS